MPLASQLVGTAGPAPTAPPPHGFLHPPTPSPWQPDPTTSRALCALASSPCTMTPSSYPHHHLPLNLRVSAEKLLSGNFSNFSGPAAGVVAPPVPPQIPIFSPLLVQITTSCNCLCTHGVREKRKPLSLISLSPMPGRVPGTWSPQ